MINYPWFFLNAEDGEFCEHTWPRTLLRSFLLMRSFCETLHWGLGTCKRCWGVFFLFWITEGAEELNARGHALLEVFGNARFCETWHWGLGMRKRCWVCVFFCLWLWVSWLWSKYGLVGHGLIFFMVDIVLRWGFCGYLDSLRDARYCVSTVEVVAVQIIIDCLGLLRLLDYARRKILRLYWFGLMIG